MVRDSVRNYEFNPIIDQWMVSTTMLQSLSIGAGGGSIASMNEALGGRLEVGPRSAGSYPGPVAYQLGGTEPTVTDANLVLGYLSARTRSSPAGWQLDKEAAEEAIKTTIADPLGVSTVEAAALIRRIIDDKMASAIRKEVTLRGYRPTDFTLFAFGGGGPTHVAGYMGEIPRAVMFPFSPVFCAYGSSIMDVVHLYERSHRMMLLAPLTGQPALDHEAFNSLVRELMDEARARGRGRGAELGRRDQSAWSSTASTAARSTPSGRRRRCCSWSPTTTCGRSTSASSRSSARRSARSRSTSAGGVYIDTFVLRVAIPGQELELPELETADERRDAGRARGRRTSTAGSTRRCTSSRRLQPGHSISGPAIVQAAYTTAVIPPGRRFHIENHGLGILEDD